MSADTHADVAIVGAGIAGIATAYYLCVRHAIRSVLLIDSRQAMSFTSAQPGGDSLKVIAEAEKQLSRISAYW